MSAGVPTEFAVRALSRFVYPVVRVLHRASWSGVENLPPHGAYLLVGNHPPALGLGEFFSLMALWARAFGRTRPLAGFAHVAAHRFWPFPWFFRHLGMIPSTYEAAGRALADGVPIAVFPGGDHEGFRPFWRREVDFHGRRGFLRIAASANVPIVPFAIRGESAPVLLRGKVFAWLAVVPRAVGVKRWGITVLGAVGAVLFATLLPLDWPWRFAIAYLWLFSPLSLLSWVPTHTHIEIGEPLPPSVEVSEVERAVAALLVRR